MKDCTLYKWLRLNRPFRDKTLGLKVKIEANYEGDIHVAKVSLKDAHIEDRTGSPEWEKDVKDVTDFDLAYDTVTNEFYVKYKPCGVNKVVKVELKK